MDNINTTPQDELELLRQQMASLNKALESQKIVNARLLGSVMRNDVSWFRKVLRIEVFVGVPVSILLFLFITLFVHTSWLFFGVTALMFIADAFWDSIIMPLPASDFSTLSLIELRRKTIRQIRLRKIQFFIEVPLLVLWTVWFFYELAGTRAEVLSDVPAIVWGVTVTFGFVLGLLVAIVIYAALNRRSRKIINQIDNFVEIE